LPIPFLFVLARQLLHRHAQIAPIQSWRTTVINSAICRYCLFESSAGNGAILRTLRRTVHLKALLPQSPAPESVNQKQNNYHTHHENIKALIPAPG
jgi:hypothetical protein